MESGSSVSGSGFPIKEAESSGKPLCCLQAEIRAHGFRQFPGDAETAVPIHDCHQVKEAAAQADVCDVHASDLVRGNDYQAPEKVSVSPSFVLRHAQPAFRVDRF